MAAHVSGANFLGILGLLLGPALAAGHNIVIHTEIRFSFIIFLLIELSIKVGYELEFKLKTIKSIFV